MFEKSASLFPIKDKCLFLSSCGVSPLFRPAMEAELEFARSQTNYGHLLLSIYPDTLARLHESSAALLRTEKENMSFVKNTAEAMNMIANGFPLQAGDEILVYEHEYPANYYPWKMQERRGARVVHIPDADLDLPDLNRARLGNKPIGWRMEDLDALVTSRTRIIAISHVQFTSGFACDLKKLGAYCRERSIDLVVDAAQSLGCLPIYPEELGVAALASSGWKWLMGPIGCGLLYTAPEFRARLADTMAGANLMKQGFDYLNHAWDPVSDGGRFEYSTASWSLAEALDACLRQVFMRYGIENISSEIFRLQAIVLSELDRSKYAPLEFPEENRSGILSLHVRGDAERLAQTLLQKGVACTVRGGYLRIAPHYYLTDDELRDALGKLNEVMVLV